MRPVPRADVIEILIASDAWGTRAILRICRDLPREQFHRRFEIGLGSLHETLTHVVSTMRRWTDRLAQREPRAPLHAVPEFPHLGGQAQDRSPDELLAMLDHAERDLAAVMARITSEARLASIVTLEWPDKNGSIRVHTFTRAAVLAHVTTHGYHHRAQCLNMLRQLGAPVPGITQGFPELSAVDWQSETECPPTIRPVSS